MRVRQYLVITTDTGNCFADNSYGTLKYIVPPLLAGSCP
jgi:hypothetical protein